MKNGTALEGNFIKNSLPTTNCIKVFENGTIKLEIIEGTVDNGFFTGKGSLKGPEWSYEGNFLNDQKYEN